MHNNYYKTFEQIMMYILKYFIILFFPSPARILISMQKTEKLLRIIIIIIYTAKSTED